MGSHLLNMITRKNQIVGAYVASALTAEPLHASSRTGSFSSLFFRNSVRIKRLMVVALGEFLPAT